jgi:hypothetical protein
LEFSGLVFDWRPSVPFGKCNLFRYREPLCRSRNQSLNLVLRRLWVTYGLSVWIQLRHNPHWKK